MSSNPVSRLWRARANFREFAFQWERLRELRRNILVSVWRMGVYRGRIILEGNFAGLNDS